MTLRTDVRNVLSEADRIEQIWERANATTDGPTSKEWEADDDARRVLSHDAVDVLREIVAAIEGGQRHLFAAAPPELIFAAHNEHTEAEQLDDQLADLDPEQTYSVCPHCSAINGGIVEVDHAERWNRVDVEPQPDLVAVYGPRTGLGWVRIGEQQNPLAGLPRLSIHVDGSADFHTDRHICGSCSAEISLPEWVQSEWI